MNRFEAMQYVGLCLVTFGIAFVYWPLALIIPGIALVILAQIGGQS